jgi:hypothetical protein
VEENALSKLQTWLQYEKYTWFIGAGIVWVPYSLILTGLLILAVIFTPFMLWHLYRAKWYKSISVFFLVVIFPVAFRLLETGSSIVDFLLMVLPLLTFYCYTWILSHTIDQYLSEIQTAKKWKKEKLMNN